jgi:hypothetical protein
MNNRVRVELKGDVLPQGSCAVNLIEHIARLQYALDSVPDEFKGDVKVELGAYEDYGDYYVKGDVYYWRNKTQLELQLEEEDSAKAIALEEKQRLQQYKKLQAEFGDMAEKCYKENMER